MYQHNSQTTIKNSKNYTEKHKVLSEYLLVDCSEIENDNDQIFIFDSYNEFWVLTDEESIDFLINEIDVSFEMPFKQFSLQEVAKTLDIKIETIKEFFLPDILTGEVNFNFNKIDSNVLLKYLNAFQGVSFFIDNYAKLLVDENRSGEILCSKQLTTRRSEYNIYYR